MKVSKLVGQRFKETPADCVIDSHALMVRGGYMKYVGNGIYSEFPTLKRITAKIENISISISMNNTNFANKQTFLLTKACLIIYSQKP